MANAVDDLATLLKQYKELVAHRPTPTKRKDTVVVLSGDISDVDGFYALAKYAQSGLDVVFVMNYPAYLNVQFSGITNIDADSFKTQIEQSTKNSPGKGYSYGTQDVLNSTEIHYASNEPWSTMYSAYTRLMATWRNTNVNVHFKKALTELSFFLANKVWDEVQDSDKGSLYFCIGGVNSVNPFHATIIKNELFVYADLALGCGFETAVRVGTFTEGDVFDRTGTIVPNPTTQYQHIYLDFSGSMAFFNSTWQSSLEPVLSNISGSFMMGGLHSYSAPTTMPAWPNALNRFSCATMNQLYHPENTARFLQFAQSKPFFTVCNNTVEDMATFFDPNKVYRSDDGWAKFLRQNGMSGWFLRLLANTYYSSPYNPPRKAFDYFSALALVAHAKGTAPNHHKRGRLFYNAEYAVSLVSNESTTYDAAVCEYEHQITNLPETTDFGRVKKDILQTEVSILKQLSNTMQISVSDLSFHMNKSTYKLELNNPS